MTEEKEAERQAEEPADTQEVEAEGDEQPDADAEKSEEAEESKQLKAELDRERKSREEADRKLQETRDKARERIEAKRLRDREDKYEFADEPAEKPITARELQDILAQEREAIRRETRNSEVERIAGDLSTSDDQKNLIMEVYKNRVFPSHLSLQEQLEECYVIANKKKFIGRESELLRALKNKGRVNSDASMTHQDSPKGKGPKLSSADAAEMAGAGFKSNGKRWEKKLKNGQILVQDSKGSRIVSA